MKELSIEEILIDTDNIEQIEFVRRFLSDTRNEDYDKYAENTMLKHQAFSNVIGLLATKIQKLEEGK